MGGACGTYGGKKWVTGCLWGNQTERDHFEDLGVEGRIILKCILENEVGTALTTLIWARIGTGGERL